MKKPTLTKEESDLYIKIVTKGNFDDMFDFAYQCGRVDVLKEMVHDQQKKCIDGGAYRGDDGYLVLTCKHCHRDMEDGEDRICMGKCNNECDYQSPYGFVPEAGCPIHDK